MVQLRKKNYLDSAFWGKDKLVPLPQVRFDIKELLVSALVQAPIFS